MKSEINHGFHRLHGLFLHGNRPAGMAARVLSGLRLRCLLVLSFIIFHFSFSLAQIKIGGNVYGGGNAGATNGNTQVNVYAGDLNRVYGGARMADISGHAFVHIDGEHASGYVLINYLFGGNDISGTIGTTDTTVPSEIEHAGDNGVDNTWDAFVRISSTLTSKGNNKQDIYIGQLFGAGNGDYNYSDEDTEYYGKSAPDLARTYLEIVGGSIVYAYGGGNNATVTDSTVIYVDNPSKVVNEIIVNDEDLITKDNRTLDQMGLNPGYTYPSSDAFQIGSLFGGNNTAEMKIRPRWNLQSGSIRNLYSGGNRGPMTSPYGLLLQVPENSSIIVDNLYGGCRMADIIPTKDGAEITAYDISKDDFGNALSIPSGFSARTRILGGHVNNVYGGNDITGRVAGGCTVGIYSTVYGDVYGGGNGSYPYTDNDALKNDPTYGDLYYTIPSGKTSVQALNAFRPNAEQVSIFVSGTENKKTIVHGSIYCGGNSASLSTTKSNPKVELKIGSYVIADNVFLGNNGEHMVATNEANPAENILEGVLRTYKKTLADVDPVRYADNDTRFTTMDLTDSNIFAQYMDGVVMTLMPQVVFANENDGAAYIPHSSYFGSFYCGGNVGSMKVPGTTTYNFNHEVIIYNKLVGGCNNADVEESSFNAAYSGGLLGADSESTDGLYVDSSGNIQDRLQLNLSGLLVRPMRWRKKYYAGDDMIYTTLALGEGESYDTTPGFEDYVVKDGQHQLEWNTVSYNSTRDDVDPVEPKTSGSGASSGYGSDDWRRRFDGGNIYGGCYNSGHVNGNVVININSTIHEPDQLFDAVVEETADRVATDRLYDIRDDYTISQYRTGVAMHTQGMDPLGQALNVFGGGKGAGTEIWGSATINLRDGFTFQIFGGSEEGVIGKNSNIAYKTVNEKQVVDFENSTVDERFSTYVNLNDQDKAGSETRSADLAEAIFIYGGGFEGPILGNSIVHLDNGRLFNSFAGSCNADILGHTETYVGQTGFPYIIDHIYGGNDLGGTIFGSKDYADRISSDIRSSVHGYSEGTSPVLTASAYTEYTRGHVDYIFGGCYGDYDYSTTYQGYTSPRMDNAMVNFRPNSDSRNSVNKVFGAGQGQSRQADKDIMQNRSYVLIDIPQSLTNFQSTEVFGAGAFCGVGMGKSPAEALDALDSVSAIIDLMRGQIAAAYGGSYQEGVTRRTVVNVPAASTISIGNIFGGAYGTSILPPCDVYESNVNYHNSSELATVTGAIYGGNNSERRTLYTHVNISSPVWSNKASGFLAKVYGAGKGIDTWSEYTEVNLLSGARVYEVYGGGEMGHVLNAESVQKYMQTYISKPSKQISDADPDWGQVERWEDDAVGTGTIKSTYATQWAEDWTNAWKLGGYYTPNASFDNYVANALTNLTNTNQVTTRGMDDRDYTGYAVADTARIYQKYNTNVIINEGATVVNYAYGGGWGQATTDLSGDVYGTTFVALLGGTVQKDIYAAGTSGSVDDIFGVGTYNASSNTNGFTASANVYIKGGTCRNVYGGGWEGAVGWHNFVEKTRTNSKGEQETYRDYMAVTSTAGDVPGETHVVIGDLDGTSFLNGIPAIERNAYGGGEGGPVFGTAYITLNKGFIGYRYFASKAAADADHTAFASAAKNGTAPATAPAGFYLYADGSVSAGSVGGSEPTGYYQEKLHDETWTGDGTGRLDDSGNIFGGGYIDNSYVDRTEVTMMGGLVRNALFGGGEIAAIGRGIINASGVNNSVRSLQGIYKAGHTHVKLYGGQVHRNVFGGGRGYNNLGEGGTLYSDGYVFGQTEVDIFGGEVGTDEELAKGNGNVFGGGDIGYVYSAYEEGDSLYVGIKDGKRYDGNYEGYYYAYKMGDKPYIPDSCVYNVNDPNWLMDGTEYILTEDCKVLVEPHTRVITDVSINGHTYKTGEYVPTDSLQYLKNKNNDADLWSKLDVFGIIIHNAVFAGGNTSSGSSRVFANATSIFGNATASIHDIYHRDLITVGTGHTGGLYGDGNLTFVDGYRGLNITNYGTDYYSIEKEINIDQYHALPDREAAYYELRYMCKKTCIDKDGTRYTAAELDSDGNIKTPGTTISADDLITLFEGINDENGNPMVDANGQPQAEYWSENGVCSRYAGRIMNTIQRADFCGVFGSRMVMQGAQDRVPEIVDYTNYTINRVREVSLNKKTSKLSVDAGTDRAMHGNYFGIYNIVNFLGGLTSDVDFGDEDHDGSAEGYYTRTTDNSDTDTYGPDVDVTNQTFYQWKKAHYNERKRNNGNSHNQVALASGVYLELTTEQSTGDDLYEKVWGTITGVIELDLINVQTGIGGGFVYARNEHGVRTRAPKKHATLTKLNKGAVTQADFTYTTDDSSKKEWQTSGNFVHSTQTIIDDCYNISGKYFTNYNKPDGVPAHYWYIKGSVYVYDQYISAYTGAPNAYSETVDIPLTITAASHGEMKLLNVQPNLYAYYSSPGVVLGDDKRVIINDVTYYKNDPISYWDWYLLSASEKQLFVPETYVTIADCKIGETEYPEGTVLLPSEYRTLRGTTPPTVKQKKVNDDGSVSWVEKNDFTFDYVFRSSNNMSHNTGYILTYRVNNPLQWDTWYTEQTDKDHTSTIAHEKNQTGGDDYHIGPTYHLINEEGELLGQRQYHESNIISKEVYDTYNTAISSHSLTLSNQATFEPAYYVTEKVTIEEGSNTRHLNPGAIISDSYKTEHSDVLTSSNTSVAYVCTSTIQLASTEYIYLNTKMSEAERTAYINRFRNAAIDGEPNPEYNTALATAIEENIVPAYYCTEDGLYGGNYYESGKNYRGLEAWSSMSAEDRAKFAFNYDALDLIIDTVYSYNTEHSAIIYPEGEKYQYDSSLGTLAAAQNNDAGYSLPQAVNYTATYNGTTALSYKDKDGNSHTIDVGAADLTRTEYEAIPNEKRHYSAIKVESAGTYYVVNNPFQVGSSPYAVGAIIKEETYNDLPPSDRSNITQIYFDTPAIYYYCREAYTIWNNGEGHSVTSLTLTDGEGDYAGKQVLAGTTTTISSGNNVPIGTVISASNYEKLVNKQLDFTIHGIAPTETSTLYVSRNSDIFDLSTEKIITVIYQYDYDEVDTQGNVTPQSERHVVNIHVQFKSGIPLVENIKEPELILPGDYVALREPNVTPGAYEVTGGGWELFESIDDAESHTNGISYSPTFDELYWYQDGYYVAYYAQTYLGKTYSNHVPVSVANYHDLQAVMNDKEHHYYVDNPDVHRDSKIYINDYSSQNGLNLLKQFYDLSLLSVPAAESDDPLYGHSLLDSHVRAADSLEFFLRTDLSADADASATSGFAAWTPIGSDACFAGTLHGDGHTISGLDHSLFSSLCGSVYNLGVTGSFTSAGIVDTGCGYVENCWTRSSAVSGSPADKPYAVFGNPSRDSGTQLVNCYYWDGNNDLYKTTTNATTGITTSGGARGVATQMPDTAFYNGTVAYNLNGFYLYKRFCDHTTASATNATAAATALDADTGSALGGSAAEYSYWLPGTDTPKHSYYGSNPTLCSAGNVTAYYNNGYVEDRFADGDFRYAAGTIPETADERTYTDPDTKATAFYPIWPDDYLFFGQMLTYGWDNLRPHEPLPTQIYKDNNRLASTSSSNRVYRAPAYFRSKQMDVAHYNPWANLAAYSKPKNSSDTDLTPAYPGMTAIDFTGLNDNTWSIGTVSDGFAVGKPAFYPPLLDNDGLIGIANRDETNNLLIYIPESTVNVSSAEGMTRNVVTNYASDPDFTTFYPGDSYRTVAANNIAVNTHVVERTAADANTYQSTYDHFLVDLNDFNAPISYSFVSGKRMWYQRRPTLLVDRTKGWEAISLPFTAELVTTQQKGEITHFYSGSDSTFNSTNTKLGHEYWLRHFTGIDNDASTSTTIAATMAYPSSAGDGFAVATPKTVKNTFLWDYYYEASTGHNHRDANTDTYQTYYSVTREYADYPLLTAAKPYIIGFPGSTYYEFDLSGQWKATTTASPNPSKLDAQVITFASAPSAQDGFAVLTIEVSDDETIGVTKDDYTFRPTYQNSPRVATSQHAFLLSSDGSSYVETDAPEPAIVAFRPYFTAAASNPSRPVTRSILFVNGSQEEEEPFSPYSYRDGSASGTLAIATGRHRITVTSALQEEATVQIASAAGQTVALFSLQPGEAVTTRIPVSGIYIVRTADGRFTKKLSVR